MTRVALVIAILLGLAGVPVADIQATTRMVQVQPAPPVTRIMLVGDSITHGTVQAGIGDYTWRYRLARRLAVADARFTFVGPRDDLYLDSHAYADPGFPQHHAAFWGRLLAEATKLVYADTLDQRPDVIVLLAGTNDVNTGHSTSVIEADLNAFITNARIANPNVAFVIGTVMPTNGVVDPVGIAAYDARIPVVAAARTSPESPISVVDTFAAINAVTDLYDGVHPNQIGEHKIANVFFPAVRALLRVK